MSLSMHAFVVESFAPMLGTLTHLTDKAREHARLHGSDVASLVEAKLAPDMFPFRGQVQLACFHAHDAVARLTGGAGPVQGMPEETIDQLDLRVSRTLEILNGTSPSALAGADERLIVIPLPPSAGEGMEFQMTGLQFVRDWSLPHFYFHVVTAYDALRNAGVVVGKRDYVRGVGRYIKKREA